MLINILNILILYLSFSISRRKHKIYLEKKDYGEVRTKGRISPVTLTCAEISFGKAKGAGEEGRSGAGLNRTLKDTVQSNAMRAAQVKGIRFSIQDDGYTLSIWKYLQTFGLQRKLCCNQF